MGGDTGNPVVLRKNQGEPFLELARSTMARAAEEGAKTGPTFEFSE
jgi:hypothetical protein